MNPANPKVLIVSNNAVEASRRTLYRELARMRTFEVHLLTPVTWREAHAPVRAEPEPEPALLVHHSRTWFAPRQHRVLYRDLPTVLRSVKPDVIVLDAEPENYAAAQTARLCTRMSPKPRLVLISSRIRDYTAIGFPYKFAFTHRLCDGMVRHAGVDAIICRPQLAADYLGGYSPRCFYLPHAVDAKEFTPKDRRVEAGEEVVIGYLGRLVAAKGVHVLIDAVSQVQAAARLKIAGEGPELPRLLSQVRQQEIDNVEFVPPIAHREVPGFLRSLDVLVLPSLDTKYWSEQFGRVLIEAMACEVPVVGSKSGGIPDVIGDVGVCVPPGDAGALAGALEKLIANPTLQNEFGKRGRQRVLQYYDASVVACQLADLLTQVI